jgi:hypothetical protein
MTKDVAIGLGDFIAKKIHGGRVERDPGKNICGFTVFHKGAVRADDLRKWTAEYFKSQNEAVELDKHLMCVTRVENKKMTLSLSNLDRNNKVCGGYF